MRDASGSGNHTRDMKIELKQRLNWQQKVRQISDRKMLDNIILGLNYVVNL